MLDRYTKDIRAGVDGMAPGDIRTAQEIVGSTWPVNAGEAAELGRQFSRAVRDRQIDGLDYVGRNDRNHHLYRKI